MTYFIIITNIITGYKYNEIMRNIVWGITDDNIIMTLYTDVGNTHFPETQRSAHWSLKYKWTVVVDWNKDTMPVVIHCYTRAICFTRASWWLPVYLTNDCGFLFFIN